MQIVAGREAEYQDYVAVNNDDDYSRAVVRYGEKWAELMEAEVRRRELIPGGPVDQWTSQEIAAYHDGVTKVILEIAEQASQDADADIGITGFMYGCAVEALARFWAYGEILRRWHNRQYLSEEKAVVADESGGVVNPAILTVGEQEP